MNPAITKTAPPPATQIRKVFFGRLRKPRLKRLVEASVVSMAVTALTSPICATELAFPTHVGWGAVYGNYPRLPGDPSGYDYSQSPVIASMDVAGPYGDSYGHVAAMADTARGILTSYVSTTEYWGGAESGASILDEFTVHGLSAGTPVSVTAYLKVTGRLSTGVTAPLAPEAFTDAGIDVDFNNMKSWDLNAAISHYSTSYRTNGVTTGSVVSIDPAVSNARDINETVAKSFTAYAGQPFSLLYFLRTDAFRFATADFRNTAKLSFNLPIGTSISSVGGFSKLRITSVPGAPEVELRWPAIGTNSVLETTTTLPATGAWQSVTNAPTVSGGDYVLTLPATEAARFFRVRWP